MRLSGFSVAFEGAASVATTSMLAILMLERKRLKDRLLQVHFYTTLKESLSLQPLL